MSESETELELGYVSGVFGVRGEVRVHLHHRESDWLSKARSVTLVHPKTGERRVTRMSARPGAGKRVVGRIDGCTTPEVATTWMGWQIVIPRSALPKPASDEFYVTDVVGLPAFVGDVQVGVVSSVHPTGPIDLLELDTPDGPAFVPCLKEFVLALDVKGGVVRLSEAALAEDPE